MRNKKKAVIITVVVVVLVAAVAIAATHINGKKKNDNEDKMEAVRRGEFVVKVRESGSLESFLSVDIRSIVEGENEQIFVKEGDYVEKDQELPQIDD